MTTAVENKSAILLGAPRCMEKACRNFLLALGPCYLRMASENISSQVCIVFLLGMFGTL